MRFRFLILNLCIIPTIAMSEETNKNKPISIVIHGGAGTILKENMTPEKEAAISAKLEESLKAGYQVLENNGTSTDAVIAASRFETSACPGGIELDVG